MVNNDNNCFLFALKQFHFDSGRLTTVVVVVFFVRGRKYYNELAQQSTTNYEIHREIFE